MLGRQTRRGSIVLRYQLPRHAVALILVLLTSLAAAGHLRLGVIERLDAWLYDARLLATLPAATNSPVVIVDIDEASLSELGRWPWSRDRLAALVEALFDDFRVQMVGFDVVFAEPDPSSGLPVLDALLRGPLAGDTAFREAVQRIRATLDYDRRFADSLAGRAIVLGFAASDVAGTQNALPAPVLDARDPAVQALPLHVRHGVTGNLPGLQANALGAGFFDNPAVDPDGVFRRMPLLYVHTDGVYESLALAMFRQLLGAPAVELIVGGEAPGYRSLEAVRVGAMTVPVDQAATVLVPFRGGYRSFGYVSAADVLGGRADPLVLEGSLVIVGSTAAGLMDLRATPVANVYPGVEIHANVLAGLLEGRFKQIPAYAPGYEVLLVVLFGVFLTVALPRVSAIGSALLVAGAFVVAAGLNLLAWRYADLSLPLASQLILIGVLFVWSNGYAYFVEAHNRRRLGRLFGQYVPPQIVAEMSRAGAAGFGIEGETRRMTVLFADIRDFTALSEGLDASTLKRLINAFLTPMTRVIHDHRGTIDKYMGDAVMAFWGAPLADTDHAAHGVATALAMSAALPAINAELAARGWPVIDIGIGVSTGVMNVGNMGSEFRMAYTVLGDAVNLASRLQDLTKRYGVRLVVSELTRGQAPGFVYRELDLVRVKGRREPVALFEPLGAEGALDAAAQARLEQYAQALAAYRSQRWGQAEADFAALARAEPACRLYREYLTRLAALRADPPPADWDCVFTHTSK
jgi:adenylate cyclase